MVSVLVKWILGTILDRVKAQITKLVFTTITKHTALRSDSKECIYVAIDFLSKTVENMFVFSYLSLYHIIWL